MSQTDIESLSRQRFCQHGCQPEVNRAILYMENDGVSRSRLKSTTAVVI